MRSGRFAAVFAAFLTNNAATAQVNPVPIIGIWYPSVATPENQLIRDPFPKTDPTKWFRPEDYSWLAPPKTGEDHELIELTIDSTGKIMDCTATSFGSDTVPSYGQGGDTTTRMCPLIKKRGAFGYALDKDGKPVSATLMLRLRISLPGALGMVQPMYVPKIATPPELLNANEARPTKAGPAGTPGLRVGVSAVGAVTFCKVDKTSGSDLVDADACRSIRAKARFRPATSASTGKPVDDEVEIAPLSAPRAGTAKPLRRTPLRTPR